MNTYKKVLAVCMVMGLILTGCPAREKYKDEKKVISTITKLMSTFSRKINDAQSPEEMINTMVEFTGLVEPYIPRLKAIISRYPAWKDNPPEEMVPILREFFMANAGFRNAADKVRLYTISHQDDFELLRAYKAFFKVASGL
jgi:hypothetical protein